MYLFCALIDRPLVDRATDTSTIEVDPFPRVARVTSIGSFAGTLLLNKKTMFLLKLWNILGALKKLLFTM